MRRIVWLVLLSVSLLAAKTVTVAAAANLSYAMEALAKAFERAHPGVTIRTIIGSSGKLTAQIRHGAPYELFLSADMDYPRALRKGGEAVTEPKVYARGALVLFSSRPRDFSRGIALLKDPAIKKIAIANPRTAPYGKAAAEALKNSGLLNVVRPRLIYGESIAQAVAYTLKAADAGLIAASALYSPQTRSYQKGRHWVPVDPTLYHPIDQGAVLLKAGERDPDARAFYAFLFRPEAQAIFRRYGYLLP